MSEDYGEEPVTRVQSDTRDGMSRTAPIPRHNCPACGCYYGTLGALGGIIPGTRYTVEGVVQKNIRLARQLRECREGLPAKTPVPRNVEVSELAARYLALLKRTQ